MKVEYMMVDTYMCHIKAGVCIEILFLLDDFKTSQFDLVVCVCTSHVFHKYLNSNAIEITSITIVNFCASYSCTHATTDAVQFTSGNIYHTI